jgi:hypothetical protein
LVLLKLGLSVATAASNLYCRRSNLGFIFFGSMSNPPVCFIWGWREKFLSKSSCRPVLRKSSATAANRNCCGDCQKRKPLENRAVLTIKRLATGAVCLVRFGLQVINLGHWNTDKPLLRFTGFDYGMPRDFESTPAQLGQVSFVNHGGGLW